MAGRLGVALADAMVTGGYAELTKDAGVITGVDLKMLARVGRDADALAIIHGKRWARVLCRPCLEWSERRPHLAGTVGAAICTHQFSGPHAHRPTRDDRIDRSGPMVTQPITPTARSRVISEFAERAHWFLEPGSSQAGYAD